ncbi:glycosyltransferase [Marinilabilia sp.]
MTNNNDKQASLIISVYNKTDFLKSVLDSVKFQTDQRFEIIISEDGENDEMRRFIKSYEFDREIYHLTQEDKGWRKNRSLNRAALFAKTNHLIFIDGDCVLHPRFIEFHMKNYDPNLILAGKRIKLDNHTSEWLMEEPGNVFKIDKYIRKNLRKIKKQGAGFVEEGLFFSPDSFWGVIPKIRKMTHLKGCNMSFSKDALMAINGFDEDFVLPAIGEDIDLQWRFEGMGYKLKSLRNLAVQYHLNHKENWINQDENIALMQRNKQKEQFVCRNGINKWMEVQE